MEFKANKYSKIGDTGNQPPTEPQKKRKIKIISTTIVTTTTT